jgi:hypothetical protein
MKVFLNRPHVIHSIDSVNYTVYNKDKKEKEKEKEGKPTTTN